MAAVPPQPTPTVITINGNPQQPKVTTPKRDVTLLNPPAQAARQGVSQIFDVLLSGTPFMRQLLLQETDVIYECRACRSLFRGLPNFVDHKKDFCTMRVGVSNAIAAQSTSSTTGLKRWLCQDKEVVPIVEPEPPEEEQQKETGRKSSKHGTPPNKSPKPKQKQQMVIRKPDQTTYILVRPIQGTTKAMEQMIIRPEQILHQSQLDNLSNFKTKRQESDGTAKIVGEIAIRQAEKAAKTAQTSPETDKHVGVEKRNSLHSTLKKVKVTSSPVNTESSMSALPSSQVAESASHSSMVNGITPASSSSSKNLLMVTLGQQKKQSSQQGNQRKAICKVCKKECKNWTALSWHERIHKKPSFKCTLCFSTSQTMYNLRRHLMNVHHLSQSKVEAMLGMRDQKLKVQVQKNNTAKSDDDDDDDDDEEEEDEEEEEEKEEPTCTVCQKTFASKRNVKRHMKIHQREGHIANNKSGGLSNEQIAKNRLLLIMDEKNMRCRKCRKQLSGLRRLQQHCCNHFGLNRYRCSLCQYENSDYTQMRRHVMGKHGRQFRTIIQISEAIKKMKVGLWINLIKLDSGAGDEDESGKKANPSKKTETTCSKKPEAQKNEEIKKDAEKPKEEVSKAKSKNAEEIKSITGRMPLVVVERVSRSRDSSIDPTEDAKIINNRASSIVSTPSKPQLRTPLKKEAEIILRKTNSSSRALSPASARKAILDSPKRETPVRQARLNHRSVSSRVAQNLNLESETEENNDKKDEMAAMKLMMDKRQLRCTECNKQFQYASSLQRHVRTHLVQESAAEKVEPAKGSRVSPAYATSKAKRVDSYINHSQLKCTKCHKRFINLASVKRHVGRHLGYSTYKCRFCSYVSRNYTWFKKHLTLSHPNNIKDVTQFGTLIASMKAKQPK